MKYWKLLQQARTHTRQTKLGVQLNDYRRHLSTAEESPLPTPLPAVTLRNYQEECIQAILSHHEQGHRRLGVSLATGSGKTVIFTQLIDRVKPIRKDGTQTLILVHRRELVEQAARHCHSTYPDKFIEIEMGAKHASGNADVTIASVQSIISGDRMSKFDPKKFKLVLIDEAHHATSKSYTSTLAHFGAMKEDADVNLVGVSATMSRADGVRLGAVMDRIVYHRDFIDMIDDGWLSKVMFTTVRTHVDLSQVKTANGDFNISELSQAVNTDDTNSVTVRSWIERAGKRKSTLVFCVDIAHVIAMTVEFRKHGYDARYITSETNPKERTKQLEAFKAGAYPVLVNCGVFTEGTDIPNIDCVLLARPTKSKNLLIQMIGRGMRLFKDKENCHVIDMVGAVTKGIVTTPSLYGLDPSELVKTASPEEMKARSETIKEVQQKELELRPPQVFAPITGVTFTDYDSIVDLVADTRLERFIRQYSANAWVGVGPSKYILSIPKVAFMRIEKGEGDFFTVTETRSMISYLSDKYKNYYMRPRTIVPRAESLEQAVHAADTYASSKFPRIQIEYRASWRSLPATPSQCAFLRKMRKDITEDSDLRPDLTKGEAGDMITKLKHGAQGELDKSRRIAKKEAKERQAVEREGSIRLNTLGW